jgi:CRISPR-associated protein Cas1
VNALLSFGYTLLANAVRGAVEAVGLDPYAGFLHRVAYNRPSLALDIVEEFRPMVDGLVLGWIRRGCVKRQDFQEGPEERPVILEAAALRRFIRAFEKRLEGKIQHPVRSERLTMRRCFLEQARQVAGSIRSGEPNYLDLGFR